MLQILVFVTIVGLSFASIIVEPQRRYVRDIGDGLIEGKNSPNNEETEIDNRAVGDKMIKVARDLPPVDDYARNEISEDTGRVVNPGRGLTGDLEDLVELVDVDAVMAVVVDYLNDDEVVNLIMFLVGPEFKKMVEDFEAMEEFKEAIAYLSSKGVHVEDTLNSIHEAVGLPPYQRLQATRQETGGVSSLIRDILQVLPLEEMKALYTEKLSSSAELAALQQALAEDQFLDILARMRRSPVALEARRRFEVMGVDFEYIEMIINDL